MTDVLSGGVTRGLIGASAHIKTAEVCMSVYRVAERENDYDKMKRAMGYASENVGGAIKDINESKNSLKENTIAAREERKAEETADLEKNRDKTVTNVTGETAPEENTNNEGDNKYLNPKDTVEISLEGAAALQKVQSSAEPKSEPVI